MCMGPFDSGLRNFITLVLATLAAAIGFYFLVIEPRDRAGMAIMQCMGGDRSYESYELCVTQLSP